MTCPLIALLLNMNLFSVLYYFDLNSFTFLRSPDAYFLGLSLLLRLDETLFLLCSDYLGFGLLFF